MFGSAIEYSNSQLKWFFQGIIHSAYLLDGAKSSSYIQSNILTPRDSPAYLCDYYTSYFSMMTTMSPTNTFYNMMSSYNSQNGVFANGILATVDATDGLEFASGNFQSITGLTVTAQKAIGVRFWFKGSFAADTVFLYLHNSGSGNYAAFTTSGNDIRATQIYSSSEVVFSNAKTTLSSSAWTLFGFSVGYTARNTQYML